MITSPKELIWGDKISTLKVKHKELLMIMFRSKHSFINMILKMKIRLSNQKLLKKIQKKTKSLRKSMFMIAMTPRLFLLKLKMMESLKISICLKKLTQNISTQVLKNLQIFKQWDLKILKMDYKLLINSISNKLSNFKHAILKIH